MSATLRTYYISVARHDAAVDAFAQDRADYIAAAEAAGAISSSALGFGDPNHRAFDMTEAGDILTAGDASAVYHVVLDYKGLNLGNASVFVYDADGGFEKTVYDHCIDDEMGDAAGQHPRDPIADAKEAVDGANVMRDEERYAHGSDDD